MNGSKANILCVDDNPELLSLTSEILRSEGYEVIEASTGNECLETAEQEHPDLILLDVNLPDINGIDVCRRIKASPELSDIYVILISGTVTSSESQVNGLEAGADGYIARPVSHNELLSRVQAMIRLKKAETALRQKITDLEEAKLSAEAANKAKSDFLANMSHELTTPLNSVIGFSQILQDELFGNLNEKQREYVSDILTSGQHLLTLITEMIDFSMAISGSIELRLGRFFLKDALKSAMTVFNKEAVKHNLKLDLEIEPKADIEIEADSEKFNQIIFILLSNAVKFTPEGGSVRVGARRVRSSELGVRSLKTEEKSPLTPLFQRGEIPPLAKGDEGGFSGKNSELHSDYDYIEITVEDTGIGIKPEDIPHIFRKLGQLESPYAKKYSGTGVGLMLAKKLVELHGGTISAESEPGKGSMFKFVIPAAAIQAPAPIVDPVTKLLAWEHFLRHISRILSYHKRELKSFALLRIDVGSIIGSEEHISLIKILSGLVRRHEILSKSKEGLYYLIAFEADRKVAEDTELRIAAALKENGYEAVLKTAVYMEDGEDVDELLKALDA